LGRQGFPVDILDTFDLIWPSKSAKATLKARLIKSPLRGVYNSALFMPDLST